MNSIKPNAEQTWKQIEDILVPRLRLSVIDRIVYYHLLRHTRLEGKRQLRFSIPSLARAVGLSAGPVRESVRRLAGHGALRLVRRSKQGHVADLRLPDEIRAARFAKRDARELFKHHRASGIEQADFFADKQLRHAIHARESGSCFYCLRRIPATVKCLDHVVPQARRGRNSYRNLVSCCLDCNSRKGERDAAHLLRSLYRDRRLTASELSSRLRALDRLASGKLRPQVSP